jgi:hypothetical protein
MSEPTDWTAVWHYQNLAQRATQELGKQIERLRSGGDAAPAPSPFAARVSDELCRARGLHRRIASAHEGYAVILEEVTELQAEVFTKGARYDRERLCGELVQIGAMCQRMAEDIGYVTQEKATGSATPDGE